MGPVIQIASVSLAIAALIGMFDAMTFLLTHRWWLALAQIALCSGAFFTGVGGYLAWRDRERRE